MFKVKFLGKKDPNYNPTERLVNKRLSAAVSVNRPHKNLLILKERTKNFLENITQFMKHSLDVLGIKHSLARVNRPQTNGKVERFFRTYKEEFATGSFSSFGDFVKHYNEERLHMSLHYKTPKEVWEELKCKPLS